MEKAHGQPWKFQTFGHQGNTRIQFSGSVRKPAANGGWFVLFVLIKYDFGDLTHVQRHQYHHQAYYHMFAG